MSKHIPFTFLGQKVHLTIKRKTKSLVSQENKDKMSCFDSGKGLNLKPHYKNKVENQTNKTCMELVHLH